MNECQKQFEEWATDGGKWPQAVELSGDHGYKLMKTHNDWLAWQASWEAQEKRFHPVLTYVLCDTVCPNCLEKIECTEDCTIDTDSPLEYGAMVFARTTIVDIPGFR